MRKMIFFAIIMIASVLPSASVCANAQVPVEEKEVNYFWFETDDCRAYFHWDGFKLTAVDILYAEKKDITPLYDNEYTLQKSGQIVETEVQPVMNVNSFSAVSDWQNEKEYEDNWLFGRAEYKKRSTEYLDMHIGFITENGIEYLYTYDVYITKGKILLKIRCTHYDNDKIVNKIIYEKKFIVED